MTQYGQPPGYGPPSAGQTQYGAPLSQGYGAPPYGAVSGPVIPPAPPTKKKPPVLLFVGIGVGVLFLGGIGAGVAVWKMRQKPVALPVEARMLPPTTLEIGTQLIEATREKDERVREAYLAAELGSEMCRMGARNPAEQLEALPNATPREAKELFFDKRKIEDIRSLLECGDILAESLDSPYQTGLSYEEDEKTKHKVAVGHFRLTELPAKYGFTRYSYNGLPGFCRTQEEDPDAKPGDFIENKGNECREKTPGAFAHGTTWFLGSRVALEGMARSVKRPKEELNARLSALQDAAKETEGLPVVRISAAPKSSKDFFTAPCWVGAVHSAAGLLEFMDGCFPAKQVERQLEEIDSKIKAAAFETDGDPQKAGAFHGNIIFVARDKDAAKDVEKDVNEVVSDWKAHVDDNEAKLINKSQQNAYSARTRKFAAVADTYFKALKNMKVKRDGRTIRISFREELSAADQEGLEDADRKTVANRQAVAEILFAIQTNKPIPEAPLAKLVGPSWAKYLTNPKASRAALEKHPLPTDECKTLAKRLAPFDSGDFTSSEAKIAFLQHRYASCNTRPPEVDDVQRSCLLTFKTAGDYERCIEPTSLGEPPASEYGDKRK